MPSTRVLGAGGSASCFWISTSSAVPENGGCPTSAWYSTAPIAYQSASGPTASCRACSGAMYTAVPATLPPESSRSIASASVARPKSSSTTRPCAVTMTLEGLMSRCTFCAACSAAMPSASWRIASRRRPSSIDGRPGGGGVSPGSGVSSCGHASASRGTAVRPSAVGASARATRGRDATLVAASTPGPPRTQVSRSTPSTSSIVKYQVSPSPNSSPRRTRFGCETSASVRNSALKRYSARASSRCKVLIATSPPRSVSSAS